MNWQSLFADGATADWILLTALHSLWLSLAGLMIIRLRTFRAPAVRSAWCTLILILLLVLPLIIWLVPRPVIRAHPGQVGSTTAGPVIADVEAPLLNRLLAVKSPVPPAHINRWRVRVNQFGFLWLAVTLGCFGRLLYGLAFLRRYSDCLREVKDDRLAAILRDINEAFDFRLRPRIFVSLTLPSPVSTGMTQPSVILPAGLYRSAGDGELRAILMHELAHIHHSDHVLGLLQRTVKALYWWNPLVYRACDTLTAAREEVSDNYAIAAMGSASSYATLLVRLLEEAPRIRRMPCVAGMAAPHECLQTRIWNIVSRNRDLRVKAGKGAISAISAAALLLCGLVGIGSQVKIFGTGQAAASEKDRPIEAGTSQAGMNVPSPPGAAPAIEAPRRSTHSHVETVQRTVPAIAPTGRTAVQFTRRTNLARSDSFPTVRNEETDAPRTTPVPLDESTQPVVRSRVEPALTPVASRARITATVTVAVIVNEKGEVYEARVRKGHPLLDRSALSAVLQWKFEPMVVDGAPRAFVATIDLYFHP